MLKRSCFALLAAVIVAQPVFADTDSADHRACMPIVKACKAAGYKRGHAEGERFWRDCMKPLLLGKSVANVTIDAQAVKDCRTAKIKSLGDKLDELKKVDQQQQ